jgi:hypothetical protein
MKAWAGTAVSIAIITNAKHNAVRSRTGVMRIDKYIFVIEPYNLTKVINLLLTTKYLGNLKV